MPNLNDPLSAAQTITGNLGGLGLGLAGASRKEWKLVEASYNGIRFHTFESGNNGVADVTSAPFKQPTFPSPGSLIAGLGQSATALGNFGAPKVGDPEFIGSVGKIQDNYGRRVVRIEYPYRDGGTTDDMGRKQSDWVFDVLMQGPGYREQYQRLVAEFNKPQPGELKHPVFGTLKVKPESWPVTHESESRKALVFQVTFIEHNFSISFDPVVKGRDAKSALSTGLAIIGKVSDAITRVQSVINVGQSVISLVAGVLDAFNGEQTAQLQRLNVTFNGGNSTDLPGLLPTNSGGASNGDGTVITDQFGTVTSPNDPFSSISVSETTQQALAALQAIDEVNARRRQIDLDIAALQNAADGLGSLLFYEEIVLLQQASLNLQDILDAGLASNNSVVRDYEVPRLMTIHEVAFDNGLDPDRAPEIEMLNPALLSTLYIEKGTRMRMPAT